jgi:hypothetical protein
MLAIFNKIVVYYAVKLLQYIPGGIYKGKAAWNEAVKPQY